LPPPLLTERWALTPPFHPCLRCEPFDIPKVFLRAITGSRFAGGIFSVALSVNRSTGCYCSPGVTRRVALASLSRSGVRTFLPFALRYRKGPKGLPLIPRRSWQASDHPAHPPIPLYPDRPQRRRIRRDSAPPISHLSTSQIRLHLESSRRALWPFRTSTRDQSPPLRNRFSC
jgi:hypothetical protein